MTIHRDTTVVSLAEAMAFNPNWTTEDRRLIAHEIERLKVDSFSTPPARGHVNLMRGSVRVAYVTQGRIIYQPDTPAPAHSEPVLWSARNRYRFVPLSTALLGVERPAARNRPRSSPSTEEAPAVCPSCHLTLTATGACPSDCED